MNYINSQENILNKTQEQKEVNEINISNINHNADNKNLKNNKKDSNEVQIVVKNNSESKLINKSLQEKYSNLNEFDVKNTRVYTTNKVKSTEINNEINSHIKSKGTHQNDE